MGQIEVVLGDITTRSADAIVNAANTSLRPGGGVDGAITRTAGPQALADRERVIAERGPTPLPTGEAVATIAGDLDARWIIHTAGPVYSGAPSDAALLASCHRSVLRVADELGARTVAFPAISTGIFGYPVELAAPVAIAAVRQADTEVEQVHFVLFSEHDLEVFRDALSTTDRAFTSKPTPLVAFAPAMSDQATNETLSDVRAVHERLAEIQLVDCRELYEWEAGRVDGAVYLPLNSIMAGAGTDLDHDRPVAVICRSGNRSELATMMLQARGFEAYNVEGGMEAWAAAGLPFSAGDGSPGRVA